MNQAYITNIIIDHVRHLKDIEIPLSENRMKHLIITGKNGSGKTSLLDTLAAYLDVITHPAAYKEWYAKKMKRDKSARREYFDVERNRRQRGDIYITQI